jgi:hypothetical protein
MIASARATDAVADHAPAWAAPPLNAPTVSSLAWASAVGNQAVQRSARRSGPQRTRLVLGEMTGLSRAQLRRLLTDEIGTILGLPADPAPFPDVICEALRVGGARPSQRWVPARRATRMR